MYETAHRVSIRPGEADHWAYFLQLQSTQRILSGRWSERPLREGKHFQALLHIKAANMRTKPLWIVSQSLSEVDAAPHSVDTSVFPIKRIRVIIHSQLQWDPHWSCTLHLPLIYHTTAESWRKKKLPRLMLFACFRDVIYTFSRNASLFS